MSRESNQNGTYDPRVAGALPSWLTGAAAAIGERGVVVAPAGHGKTAVLDLVAERHAGPVHRVRGRRSEQDEPLAALEGLAGDRRSLLAALGDDGLLVVDDAQWLDEASLLAVVGAADRGGAVVVAHRPTPVLGELDRVLRPPVRLSALGEDDAGEHLALHLGAAVEPALVDAALARTEGVPALLDVLVDGWAADGRLAGGRLVGDPDPLPTATVDAIRDRTDEAGDPAAAVLGVLALGASLDDGLLADVSGVARDELVPVFDELRALALLVPGHDEPVRVVADGLVAVTPPEELRARHAGVVAALRGRGVPAGALVDHVVAADLAGEDAVAVLVDAAVAVLSEDPEQAGAWLDRARAVGGDPQLLAAPAAVAAFARGRPDEALLAADDVPATAAPADRARAASVRAAVLGGRGLWARAGDDLAAIEGDPAALGWSVIARLGAGDRLAAQTALDDAADGGPSLAAGASVGAARHLVAAVSGDLDLTGFADAAELAERRPLGPAPVTPHALGVVVATAAGELTVARDLAERALRHGVGGPVHDRRHRLLLGWVALREGRWDGVEAALAEPEPADEPTPQAVLAAALEAGLARRSGDLSRLVATWERAEPLLLRQPVSPFAVEPTAELVICAHRLGAGARVAPVVAELEAVSADLPLWAMVLDWLLLQAAVAADDSDAVAARARAVGTRPAPGPRLVALAPAASAWLAVLAGEVHEDQVADAADGLVAAGLVWEASRLVGQAAIRTTDGTLARTLLERARDVKGLLPAERDPDAEATPVPPSVLSERELEVGALVVDGLTHKEIGAQLYISPKTVEHHVAKIRQKLGASTRAELLVALRGATGP